MNDYRDAIRGKIQKDFPHLDASVASMLEELAVSVCSEVQPVRYIDVPCCPFCGSTSCGPGFGCMAASAFTKEGWAEAMQWPTRMRRYATIASGEAP